MTPTASIERQLGYRDPMIWHGFDHDLTHFYPVVSLENYPLQRGWTPQQLQQFKSDPPPLDNADVAMIQAWLSLGLLESALQERVPSTLFLRTYNQSQYIDLHAFRRYLFDKLECWNGKAFQRHAWQFKYTLIQAQDWNKRMSSYHTNPVAKLFNPVARCLSLISDLLDDIHYLHRQKFKRDWPRVKWEMTLDNYAWYKEALILQGWCPSTETFLAWGIGVSGLEYATSIGPGAENLGRHANCTSDKCNGTNVDTETTTALHTSNCSGCATYKPSFLKIRAALMQSQVPLIDSRFIWDEYSTERSVVVYDGRMEYIAFSHVWIDGIRSNSEAGLPSCQLQRLCEALKRARSEKLCRSSLFWIDGLCIPKQGELRSCAIDSMAYIFKNAAATIVLDLSLESLSSQGSPIEWKLAQVLLCTWNRRLWTLQESKLSRQLVFHFNDYLIRASELVSEANRARYMPFLHRCVQEINRFCTNDPLDIVSVSRMLSKRTSSRLTDEPLAIAPLFGLSTKSLHEKDGDERWCEFWTLIKKVPEEIIFTMYPRVKIQGFGWAPRTFMHPFPDVFRIHESTDGGWSNTGKVTNFGLLGKFWIVWLPKTRYIDVDRYNRYQFSDMQGQNWRFFYYKPPYSKPRSHMCRALAIPAPPKLDEELLGIVGVLLSEESSVQSQTGRFTTRLRHQGRVGVVYDPKFKPYFHERLCPTVTCRPLQQMEVYIS
jgi:hypothetical protein